MNTNEVPELGDVDVRLHWFRENDRIQIKAAQLKKVYVIHLFCVKYSLINLSQKTVEYFVLFLFRKEREK